MMRKQWKQSNVSGVVFPFRLKRTIRRNKETPRRRLLQLFGGAEEENTARAHFQLTATFRGDTQFVQQQPKKQRHSAAAADRKTTDLKSQKESIAYKIATRFFMRIQFCKRVSISHQAKYENTRKETKGTGRPRVGT